MIEIDREIKLEPVVRIEANPLVAFSHFNGREHLLEHALPVDYAFLRARQAVSAS